MLLAFGFVALVLSGVALTVAVYGAARVRGRVAELEHLARNLSRDVELERVRATSAIGALNVARSELASVLDAGSLDGAHARAELGLVSSVLGAAPYEESEPGRG